MFPQNEVAQLEWGDGSTGWCLGHRGGGHREGPLRPLRGHLPLKGEDSVVLTVLPLRGEVPAEQAEGAKDLKSPSWSGATARRGGVSDTVAEDSERAPSDHFAATSP